MSAEFAEAAIGRIARRTLDGQTGQLTPAHLPRGAIHHLPVTNGVIDH
jgi:hypothetical protein